MNAEMMSNARSMSNAPLYVVINEGSGADAGDLPTRLEELLRAAGHTVHVFIIPAGSVFAEACRPFCDEAKAANGIIIAAGGDGTVNGIARLCYENGVPFGIIPLGTFNYFARALGIPDTMEAAVQALSRSAIREVSAGFVQEHLFLNNASFGLYPKLIRKREAATARFGRKRIIGAVCAVSSLFEKHRCYSIKCTQGESTEHHRTHMVFVGNNTLQLETLGLDVSSCTKDNRLAVVILKAVTTLQMARLIWRGIVKNLHFENRLQQFCTDEMVVETGVSHIDVVVDGEIVQCNCPLKFRVEPTAIKVLVPVEEPA